MGAGTRPSIWRKLLGDSIKIFHIRLPHSHFHHFSNHQSPHHQSPKAQNDKNTPPINQNITMRQLSFTISAHYPLQALLIDICEYSYLFIINHPNKSIEQKSQHRRDLYPLCHARSALHNTLIFRPSVRHSNVLCGGI